MTHVYASLIRPAQKGMMNILPLILFSLLSLTAVASCTVDIPSITAENGCAVLSEVPVGVDDDQVEWMWAQNVNGSIIGLTGFSTDQAMEWCPESAGDFRICARVIGEDLMIAIKQEARRLNCFLIQWQTPDFNIRAMKFYDRIGAKCKAKENGTF